MKKMQRLLFIPFVLFATISFAQTRVINGTVVSTNGPVPGATILVSGQTQGTSTDENGRFSLTIPEGRVTLNVTSIGFVAHQVEVGANESSITVNLEQAKGGLEEVVVTALVP